MTTKIILASASPRRLDLLKQIGIIPDDVIPADIDETPFKNEKPKKYAQRMAAEKGTTIRTQYQDSFILSADTVVACGQRILPKAETEEQARDCLTQLSGRRHRVFSAVTIIAPNGTTQNRISDTLVQFKPLSNKDIQDYLSTGEWHGKAGGYALQGKAAMFIKRIDGSCSGVIGLPLFETAQLLKGLGYAQSKHRT